MDSLTEESIKLFSSKRDYDRLARLEIEYLEKIYDKNAIRMRKPSMNKLEAIVYSMQHRSRNQECGTM